MTDGEDITEPVDGRVARRQRNIDAVIDVVLEMFAEDAMFPTMDLVAKRSGLSLRSLYRYFADPGELLEATIKRTYQQGTELSHLHNIGAGPLEDRIEDFVAMRLALHKGVGSVMKASEANAVRIPAIQTEFNKNRTSMCEQFEQQFEPELSKLKPADRAAAVAAGDLLTQVVSIEYLRGPRGLSVAQVQAALVTGLRSLLA